VKKREPIGERAIAADIRGDLEQPKGGVGLPTDFKKRINLPKRTKQAKLYGIYGWVMLAGALIGALIFSQQSPQNEEKAIQFAVIIVVIASSCFLTAFLIDVLTDMRHYLKAIAEKE